MAKKKDIHPGDVARVLSQSMAKGAAPPARKSVVQDSVTYYAANQHIQYWASSHRQVRTGALVDRGANGGIAGDDGEVIILLHQYAYTGKGKMIHSFGQLEYYKQEVDDKSIKVGGKQPIKTLDGYVIPLDVKSGLPYVKIRPYTNEEWDSLPHVVLTRDGNRNPSVLDHSLTDNEQWYMMRGV
jgi:hypothetical protein